MKVSDYIMNFIASIGVEKVFYIPGGGAMHLNDSLGHTEGLEGVCMIHEQGASIAAESYARVHEGYGACLVTSGPGATNALTGLVGAYMDSIPVIFISGQVKTADLRTEGLRQFGIQEVDILSMATPYTKYSVQLTNKDKVKEELCKAATIAMEGRPGPVWIDVPLDIQAMQIEDGIILPENCDEGNSVTEHILNNNKNKYPAKDEYIDETIRLYNESKRPVIILGHGIRLSHSVDTTRELYNLLDSPVLVSWNGVDLIEEDHPLYFGRPGSVGHRASNLIQQNADFVLTLGTRINLLSSGYNYEGFLKRANHVMVDIDIHEMEKKNVHPQVKACCDVSDFINKLLDRKEELIEKDNQSWKNYCRTLWEKYPAEIDDQAARDGFVSNYHLVDAISNNMNCNDIYQFTSSGTTVDIAMKVVKLKWGQRAFLTKALAAMGYDIPASIGSCIASGNKRTICVTGDGSAAMNLQELEVIKRRNLPVKLFISDNSGYSMIYGSQNGNFKGRLTGCTKESGLTLPNIGKVAEAIGIKSFVIENEDRLNDKVAEVMNFDGPAVCVVNTDILQKIVPKQANYMKEDGQMASRPLEDMAPLLDRDELESLMIYD